MKGRVVLVMMLVAVFLLPTGTASAGAGGPSKVTGGIGFEEPWGNAWIEFSVDQVALSTLDAKGMVHARVYNPVLGWKRLWYEPMCVSFTEVNGEWAATVVAVIVRREGWDNVPYPGQPGEYFKWQLVDGGTPARRGDAWSIQWYKGGPDGILGDPWIEYWPTPPDGGCRDFRGSAPDYPVSGNLVIH